MGTVTEPKVQRSLGEQVSECIAEAGPYRARIMGLTWPKLFMLWEQLKKFRVLFSDLTKGDFDNFVRYVTSPDTFWLEIYNGGEVVGLVTLEGIERLVEANAHVLFLDKHLADKIDICKEIVKWLFGNFTFHRLTVEVPVNYYWSVRLVKELGFKHEGRRREVTLIEGKWVDSYTFGLLRQEVEAS